MTQNYSFSVSGESIEDRIGQRGLRATDNAFSPLVRFATVALGWMTLVLVAPVTATPQSPAPAVAVADHAIVSGFDRLHAQLPAGEDPAHAAQLLSGGYLLLGELNCTSCHQVPAAAEALLLKKQAPYLGEIAQRADPRFLQKFIANTHGTKPGTTMPSLLAHLPPEQAQAQAAALTHYLASLASQPFSRSAVDTAAIGRGQNLFHKVGCVACHAPREDRGPAPVNEDEATPRIDLNATSIPLSRKLHEKYSLAGLFGFLQNPLAIRPSGRMPHLHLTAQEANDIANYLLKDTQVPAPLRQSIYEHSINSLAELDQLQPTTVGNAFRFELGEYAGKSNFAMKFEGYLEIPTAGDYTFFVSSDDGTGLWIDDQLVVDNDGIHATQQKSGTITLQPGKHAIRLVYFQGGGQATLNVKFKGPNIEQGPIPSALLTASKDPPPAEQPFVVDAQLAREGARLFTTVGCANCHQLGPTGDNPPGKAAPPIVDFRGQAGCLAPQPAAAHPFYQLNDSQQSALREALTSIQKSALPERSLAEQTHFRLMALNCYACHKRSAPLIAGNNGEAPHTQDFGGVIRERDPYFTANSPDLGDEGRLPPTLTGVGDKLLATWITKVLAGNGVARPYMDTRMPAFGEANIGALPGDFASIDLVKSSLPIPSDPPAELKAAGHALVSKEGLGCISCHMFNRQKSLGIQALDLTTLRDRLRPEWFARYMLNPSEYRPGTRMPQAFINGKSTQRAILDGDPTRQIQALWAYLEDGRKAKTPTGLITQGLELVVGGEAVIYRNFIEGASPRGIGVGYPEEVNIAWDANRLSLPLIWQGKFMDGKRHWEGRGEGFEKPLGNKVLKLFAGPPLARLDNPEAPWPSTEQDMRAKAPGYRFLGYSLDEQRRPAFRYEWSPTGKLADGQLVRVIDFPRGSSNTTENFLTRTLSFTVPEGQKDLWYRVAAGKIVPLPEGAGTYRVDDNLILKLQLPDGLTATLRDQNNQQELLVPIGGAGQSELTLEYHW
ncbi:MAG: c-type cytochrome [Pirellulales bacterium]|nr:c-type cytochrome [Pirellulales bacterium]